MSPRSDPDTGWLADEHSSVARNRILSVAEGLFFSHGVGVVTMRQIAVAAGCSRATLYRYFPGRTELHLAYIDRTTRVIAASIDDKTAGIADPGDRLTAAVLTAIAGVRGNPALMAWFTPDAAAATGRLAMSSEVIGAVTGRFVELLGGSADTDVDWIVRVVVSFLMVPASDSDIEQQIRRYLVPVIISTDTARGDPGHRSQM